MIAGSPDVISERTCVLECAGDLDSWARSPRRQGRLVLARCHVPFRALARCARARRLVLALFPPLAPRAAASSRPRLVVPLGPNVGRVGTLGLGLVLGRRAGGIR